MSATTHIHKLSDNPEVWQVTALNGANHLSCWIIGNSELAHLCAEVAVKELDHAVDILSLVRKQNG